MAKNKKPVPVEGDNPQLDAISRQLKVLERNIMLTQKQVAEELDKLTQQSAKIAAEQSQRFDKLTAEIRKLTDIIEAGEVSTELETALTNTKAALQTLDDVIPDEPAPPVE